MNVWLHTTSPDGCAEQWSSVDLSPSLHQSDGQLTATAATSVQSAWYRPSAQQNSPHTHGCPS